MCFFYGKKLKVIAITLFAIKLAETDENFFVNFEHTLHDMLILI